MVIACRNGHTKGVNVVRFFPGTGKLLASGSMDSTVKVCLALALARAAAVR